MSDNKYKKFYFDWWKIRKSTVYLLIAIAVIGGSLAFGLNYASKNNWFVPDDSLNIPQDAARIISFEGEVRIRETLQEALAAVFGAERFLLPALRFPFGVSIVAVVRPVRA